MGGREQRTSKPISLHVSQVIAPCQKSLRHHLLRHIEQCRVCGWAHFDYLRRLYHHSVLPHLTICHLEKMFEEVEGIPPLDQRLIYKGSKQLLHDLAPLGAYTWQAFSS